MPPRFAYWTILIDDAPTAFRARDRADLVGVFRQLANRNPNVSIKWFSNGRLWNSPEEARADAKASRERHEPRGSDWRPGGKHEDPRARFGRPNRPSARGPKRDATPRGTGGESDSSPRPGQTGQPESTGGRRPPHGAPYSERGRRDQRAGERRGPRPDQKRAQPTSGQFRGESKQRPRDNRPGRPDRQGGQPGAGRSQEWRASRPPKQAERWPHRPGPEARNVDRREPAPSRHATPSEPEAPAPPQPPSPERPPKPGQEPAPDAPPPETIKILPEPPERAASKPGSQSPPGAHLVRKRAKAPKA